MTTERAVAELVARCEAVMVEYHNQPGTSRTKTLMRAEVRRAAAEALGLGIDDVEAKVLRPVSKGMVARYGPERGGRVFADFRQAFEAGLAPPQDEAEGPRLYDAG